MVICRPADSNFNLISATLLGSVVTSKLSKVTNSLKCVASTVNARATVSDCARSFLRPGGGEGAGGGEGGGEGATHVPLIVSHDVAGPEVPHVYFA